MHRVCDNWILHFHWNGLLCKRRADVSNIKWSFYICYWANPPPPTPFRTLVFHFIQKMQLQVNDQNPEYDSLYMESNMDTMAQDNNPQYGTS